MDTTARLEAIEEIKKLKARYFRFVDTKQWDSLKALFTPDATFETDESGLEAVDSLDAFMTAVCAGLQGCVSVHHGHCPEIEFSSDSTASGIWPMEDKLYFDESPPRPLRSLHGMGHYHETYEKRGGAWKIASWKLTRLRVNTLPA
jgi:hypothetical protein